MSAAKSSSVVIRKMLKEISVVDDITARYTKEQFMNDVLVQRAAAMTIINIGELASVFSDDFRLQYPQIPWRKIRGLRNIIAHKYEMIDFEDVWETAVVSIPELERHLREILAEC